MEQLPVAAVMRAGEVGGVALDECRVDIVGDEFRALQEVPVEGDVGGHTFEAEFAERAPGARGRIGIVGRWRMGDQFRQQRIVIGAGAVAGIAETVDADAGAGGRLEGGDGAAGGLRRAIGGHGFHVDAQLDRVAARRRNVGLAEAEA